MSDSLQEAARLIKAASEVLTAGLKVNTYEAPYEVQVVNFSASDFNAARVDGNAFKVSFPFTSVFVQDASDDSAEIQMRVNSNDSFQGKISLNKYTVVEFPTTQAAAFLTWDVQPNKSMSLVFLVSGRIKSGKQLSDTSSNIFSDSVSDNYTVNMNTTAAIIQVAGQATTWFANPTRRLAQQVIYNEGPNTVYVGGSNTVTSSNGMPIPSGGYYYHKSQLPLYGICAAASSAVLRCYDETKAL